MKSWYWKSIATLSTAWCGYCAAIALRTPSAFAQSPAVSTENKPIILMRTAGQPDRRLQVIQQTDYANGESLAEVRDLKTGKIFTLPGKMIAIMPHESATNRAEEPAAVAEKPIPAPTVVPAQPAALAQQLRPQPQPLTVPVAPRTSLPHSPGPVSLDSNKIASVVHGEPAIVPHVIKPQPPVAPAQVKPVYVAQTPPVVSPVPHTPEIKEQREIHAVAAESKQSITTMRWRPIEPAQAQHVFHPILEKVQPKPQDRWKPISEKK